MLHAEGGEAADGKPEEEAKEWVDDGSLPLEDGDKLPFFLLDAHEEQANPGTLYLFGKARLIIGPLLAAQGRAGHWAAAQGHQRACCIGQVFCHRQRPPCLTCECGTSGHVLGRTRTCLLFVTCRKGF